MATVAALLFLASSLLHELGHSWVARREGIEVDSITLWLFGGVAQLKGRFTSAGGEFRVAVTGPLISIALGVLFVLDGHDDVGGKRWLPEAPIACLRRLSSGERGGSVTRLGPSPWEAVGPHPAETVDARERQGEASDPPNRSSPCSPTREVVPSRH